MNIINVFIVDDSLRTINRIVKGISTVNGIKVAGSGGWDDLIRYKQEPKIDAVLIHASLNGIQVRATINMIARNNKIPIVAIVNNQEEANKSLLLGVTDCCVKKLGIIDDALLISAADRVKISCSRMQDSSAIDKILSDSGGVSNLNGVIAIGASTGGTEATLNVLLKLPRRIPGIVITQHMMDKFIDIYAQRLNRLCALEVREAKDNDEICPGTVLIAPGDRHMAVKKSASGYTVRCYKGADVSGHCPSVDVLFDSMATACGRNGIGIILTGMGEDGARGLKKMHDGGAFTIGQSADGCCVYGMPQKAYEMGGVSVQRALNLIPGELMNYLRKR